MRTAEIEINGEKHLLCFNLWALLECTERYGGLGGIEDAIKSENETKAINEALWLMNTLMRGGELYAKEMGLENAKVLSVETMKAVCSAAFFVGLKAKVLAAITAGMTTNIEVEPSKNAVTSQAD